MQTSGATPLYMASEKGHVECLQTLLDGGAAINQAMVGCSTWMAVYCEGCVCGDVVKTLCMRLQLVWCAWLPHRALCGEVRVVLAGMGEHPDH